MSPQTERHDDSQPYQEPPQLRLERVGGQGVSPLLVVGALALVVVVATLLVKPWEQSPPNPLALATSGPQSTMAAVASTTARPTAARETPSISEADSAKAATARRRQCQSQFVWRLVTRETTRLGESRSLYATEPTRAEGPDDPDLPVSLLFAAGLKAVGVCVPRSPVISSTAMLHDVVLWQVREDGTVREVTQPNLEDPGLYDIGEAYFGPPDGEGPYWPAGRYVFEIRRLEGAGSRWIGLEFVQNS